MVSITAAPKITQPVQAVPRSMSVVTSGPLVRHEAGDLPLGLGPVERAHVPRLAPLGMAPQRVGALLLAGVGFIVIGLGLLPPRGAAEGAEKAPA